MVTCDNFNLEKHKIDDLAVLLLTFVHHTKGEPGNSLNKGYTARTYMEGRFSR